MPHLIIGRMAYAAILAICLLVISTSQGANATLGPFVISSNTPAMPSATCGAAYSVPTPAAPFYCLTLSYGSGLCPTSTPTPASIYVNNGNAPVPGVSGMWWADAGIGTQFVYVSWNGTNFYVASLMPSQSFSIIVYC
jgi:hypothetical protein